MGVREGGREAGWAGVGWGEVAGEARAVADWGEGTAGLQRQDQAY